MDFETLGAAPGMPGSIGMRLETDEMDKVQLLMLDEPSLCYHVRANDLVELGRFGGLERVAVVCDKEQPDCGTMTRALSIDNPTMPMNLVAVTKSEKERLKSAARTYHTSLTGRLWIH